MNGLRFRKLNFTNLVSRPRSTLAIVLIIIFYKIIDQLNEFNILISERKISSIIYILMSISHDHNLVLSTVLGYSCPVVRPDLKKTNVEVHSIVSHSVLPYYVVMAKTLTYHSGFNLKFVVHEDGTFTQDDIEELKRNILSSEIIFYRDATEDITNKLKKYPLLQKLRRSKEINKINMISTIDIPMYTNNQKIFYIDGDILFFNRPVQLIKWINSKTVGKQILFTEDFENGYILDRTQCRKYFNIDLFEKFNMGILCYSKKHFSLEKLDRYFMVLEKLHLNSMMLRDQTFYMLNSQLEKLEMVKLNPHKNFVFVFSGGTLGNSHRKLDTISCHYTHDVRSRIYSESIFALFCMKNLFPKI